MGATKSDARPKRENCYAPFLEGRFQKIRNKEITECCRSNNGLERFKEKRPAFNKIKADENLKAFGQYSAI